MGDRSEGRYPFPHLRFPLDSWFLVGAKEEENEFVAPPVAGAVTKAAHEASEETEEVNEIVTVKPTVAALTESEIKEALKEEAEEEKEAEKIMKPPVTDVAGAAAKEGDEKERETEKIIKLPTTTVTEAAKAKEVKIQIIPETELREALPRVNYKEEHPMRRSKKIRGSLLSLSSKKKKKKPILNKNSFDTALMSMLFVFVLLWFTILMTSRLHGRSLNFDEGSKSHSMLQQQWP
ncbi:hypothetical protein H6P81_017310 [Aristolochia fimbriata]|uniref:Uncharacterized protein n=1 Tax=Aristolochia fimbriata TaxID=158543 RepID=A0AAV7DZ58_ARIFI|nr:hypothetical protein H6P81_017310 [Aristolochia fimbriata]